jgi:predicted GIY-YIG superfamily endonuclease
MCQQYVYLIHFERPYKHAKHYLGVSDNLAARIACHEHGNGARLMSVIARNDIRWSVVRLWPGDRQLERKLKNFHSPQLCPVCRGDVAPGWSIDTKKLLFQKGPPQLASYQGKRRPMRHT